MIIFKLRKDLISFRKKKLTLNNTVGFVPTLGALHAGHISLINKSKEFSDITICSIFINPAQFNNPDDFKKYPVTLEEDIYKLEKNGCDILFLPGIEEVYPEGLETGEKYDLGYLENILEGKYRRGHFQGVCKVVDQLLAIVNPDKLYLGQKDYQQCMVIDKLVSLTNAGAEIIICPTLREPDGLALSSRNLRLNEDERRLAPEIYKALSFIKENISGKNLIDLKDNAKKDLEDKKFRIDYIEIADSKNLLPVTEWNRKDDLVILAAAFINEIRLIDNLIINA